MEKRLALGHQEFSEVIAKNCIYVDKTELIFRMVSEGSHYLLSRPRRFGKSLLANTLKELYLGNKELFKGLWIYDKWDWNKKHPVIKMSFSNIDHNTLGLENAINRKLDAIANEYDFELKETSYPLKFKSIIEHLSKKEKIAIIVDEYDKPIIDYMDNLDLADKNRAILKNFYSILKDADKHIELLFVTGVSKFSKVSVFSDLNNLIDITIDKNYASIVGWTKKETETYFSDYIKKIAQEYKDDFPDIMQEIQKWYNGYSWDGKTRVYNPVSLMNLFSKSFFDNYWFATGTPTFLMDIIKERKITAFDLKESCDTSLNILDKYDFRKINLVSLLFQTGYLTIKSIDPKTRRVKLDYPNAEVEESFSRHILAELTNEHIDQTQSLLLRMIDSFTENNIENFIKNLNILFKNIPYQLIDDKEKYYHSLFYLIMVLTGYQIEAEVLTIDGRIDSVIKTQENIFIIEFKINQSAQKAISQIKEKRYHEKYTNDNRNITLFGINFDTEKKRIDDYKLEKL